MNKSSAIILAAGLSKRMGRSKAFLKTPGGITFLEHIVDGFCSARIDDIVVVVNAGVMDSILKSYSQLLQCCSFVINSNPELGRFSSIKIGLRNLYHFNSVFLHNIDTPFVSPMLLSTLQNQLVEVDCCIPVFEGKGGHPVLLSGKVIQSILAESFSDCNFRDYLQQFTINRVSTHESQICLNINTEQRYSDYLNSFSQ